jgi:hypothetical protein
MALAIHAGRTTEGVWRAACVLHMRGRDRACDRARVSAHADTRVRDLASVTMSRCVRARERVSVCVRACAFVRVHARVSTFEL